MSEALPMIPSKDESAEVSSPTLTAGAMLRKAREASGLHVAALAVSMKVPVKKLEALEADRYDLLPDAVFVRALAASVCRALKLDPSPILERLPQGIAPRLDAETRGINAPFRTPGESNGWSIPEMLSKPAVLAVGILLVAALFIALFPTATSVDITQSVNPPDSNVSIAAEPPASEASSPAHSNTVDEAVPAAPLQPVTAISSRSESVTKEPSTKLMDGGVAALLSFKARGTCWVQVTDSKGVIQLNKTLIAGEVASVPGIAPMSVVIGRVDAMDVEVRGRAFNLAEVAKENVARFEVKE